MNIARIIDGIVVNLEVADEDWIAMNSPSPDGAVFVAIADGETAHMGLGWSAETGFEQPPTPPPSIPGPGQKWDVGDIPEYQNEAEIVAELEAILLAGN